MKGKAIITILFLILFAGCSFAMHSSIIGGYRGGVSFGERSEYHFTQDLALRFGVEGTTGENGLILSLGSHFLNFKGKGGAETPWFLGLGFVDYTGNNPASGFSGSLIYDPLERSNPYYAEFGVDMVSQTRVFFEIGYYFIQDKQWE